MQRATMIAIAALALACGSAPKPGEPCNGAVCEDTQSALFCQSGNFVRIPCKGAGGCISNGDQVQCNVRAVAGDACPATAEGQAQCDSADADKALKCTSGVWQSLACHACFVQSGQVKCAG